MSHRYLVSESVVVPRPRRITWSAGKDPRAFSKAVPMLRSFSVGGRMKLGARVTEVHTLLGVPQRFEGSVTRYEHGRCWEMETRPVSWGPASMPHSATYRFESLDDDAKTKVSIDCSYELHGLLRLPGVALIAEFLMRRTLIKLLKTIANRTTNLA